MKLVVTLSIGLAVVLTCAHGVVWTTEGESEPPPAGADSGSVAEETAAPAAAQASNPAVEPDS